MLRSPVQTKPMLALAAAGAGQFMIIAGATSLFAPLPQIAADLEATLSEIQWVAIAYALGTASTVPLFGRLSDVIGRKNVWLIGTLLFISGAVLGNRSWTIELLIASRLIQAVGAAGIMANTLALATDLVPAERRGTAIGFIVSMISVGGVSGLVGGGTLVTNYGWESAFFAIAIVGALVFAFSVIALPTRPQGPNSESIDWLGAVVLAVTLAAFLLGITKGQEWGWSSIRILALFAGSFLLAIFFLALEKRTLYPLVDFAMYRNRIFTVSQLTAMLVTIPVAMFSFLLPFYLVAPRGFSTLEAGALITPYPIGSAIGATLGGRLSKAVSARLVAWSGLTIFIAGSVLFSMVKVDTSLADLVWRVALASFGAGLFQVTNQTAIMSSAPANKRGSASSLTAMFQSIGNSTGTAITGVIFGSVVASQFSGAGSNLVTRQMFVRLADQPAELRDLTAAFESGFFAACLSATAFAILALLLNFAITKSAQRREAQAVLRPDPVQADLAMSGYGVQTAGATRWGLRVPWRRGTRT